MRASYPSLQGKVAIVTGANHGIGAATAKALAIQGCAVLVQYWRVQSTDDGARDAYHEARAQSADATIEAIRIMDGRAEPFECDLSKVDSIGDVFDSAEHMLGPVSVLVNNAAHWQADALTPGGTQTDKADEWPPRSPELTASSMDAHLAVNARAVALMMTEFARRLTTQGGKWGRIINISTDGAGCFPYEVAYGASKAALESLSRSAAIEFGKFGITVNIVSPGGTQTGYMTPEFEQVVARSNPLGRVGQPEDLADAIVFLASDQARWITGQLIRVNGGAMA